MKLGAPPSLSVDRSWGISAPHDALSTSLLMTSGAPTLTLSAAGAATSLSGTLVTYDHNTANKFRTPVVAGVNQDYGSIFKYANTESTYPSNGNGYFGVLTDSPDFEWIINCAGGAQFNVRVNGKYVLPNSTPATSGGWIYRLRVTFGSRALRKVEITGHVGSVTGAFRGITLGVSDLLSIAPVINPSKEIWCTIGDSFTAGVGGPSDMGGGSLASVCMTALGITHYSILGIPGLGYIAGGANVLTASVPNWVIPLAPTRLLILAGTNDVAQTAAAVAAAAGAVFDAVRAALPNTKIYAATTMGQTNANDTATQGILTAASSRTAWVTTISAGSAYVTGTGRVGTPSNNGNRDWVTSADGLHPSPYGHTYYGLRLAQDIMALRG